MPPSHKKQRKYDGLAPARPVLTGPPARTAQIQQAAAALLKEHAAALASLTRIGTQIVTSNHPRHLSLSRPRLPVSVSPS